MQLSLSLSLSLFLLGSLFLRIVSQLNLISVSFFAVPYFGHFLVGTLAVDTENFGQSEKGSHSSLKLEFPISDLQATALQILLQRFHLWSLKWVLCKMLHKASSLEKKHQQLSMCIVFLGWPQRWRDQSGNSAN